MSEAEDSLTHILEFIKANPGATPADIRKNVPDANIGYNRMQTNVTHAIRVLKLRGLIENRGPKTPGHGPGRWYAIEGDTQSLYLQRINKEIHANSLTRQILEYIKANPGCSRGDILKYIPDAKPRSVSSILQHLSVKNAIKNPGGAGLAARWVAVESEPQERYLLIAEELLEELKDIHHSRKKKYLAERLEAIFET